MNFSCFFNILKYKCLYHVLKFFYDDTLNKTKVSFDIKKRKKIVIYGFGPYGEQSFIRFFYSNRIVGIYDINFNSLPSFVDNPEVLEDGDYDYVVVTVMNEEARKGVIDFLLEKGIPPSKIVYLEYCD